MQKREKGGGRRLEKEGKKRKGKRKKGGSPITI